MSDFLNNGDMKYGTVKIANEVVAIIAGLAATEIDGVAGMSGGITGDITKILGMKNLSKGVKVEVDENEASIDIFVTMKYGSRINETAEAVQKNVKNTIETMTGLDVVGINVNVQGVVIPDEPEIEDKPNVH
ncbi:MAG: Asp23/Gls24 family envelope stress response protein [Tissierellia bacterium]|nr:Asp23/Gls24 family envelope stress response protein [Tissierellia bacterium]